MLEGNQFLVPADGHTIPLFWFSNQSVSFPGQETDIIPCQAEVLQGLLGLAWRQSLTPDGIDKILRLLAHGVHHGQLRDDGLGSRTTAWVAKEHYPPGSIGGERGGKLEQHITMFEAHECRFLPI
jgi:hypothetical protein